MSKNNSFRTAYPVEVRSKCSNIDFLYGPYSSVESACENVPPEIREIGKTVGIVTEGSSSVEEYWWEKGTADNNLVKKSFNVNWGEITGNIEDQKDLYHLFLKDLPQGYRLIPDEVIIEQKDAAYERDRKRGLIKVHDDSDYLIGYCLKNESTIDFFKINVATKQIEHTWEVALFSYGGIHDSYHLNGIYVGNDILLVQPMKDFLHDSFEGIFIDLDENTILSISDFFGISSNISKFELYSFKENTFLISYNDDDNGRVLIGYAEKGKGIVQELLLTEEEKQKLHRYYFLVTSSGITYATVLNVEPRGEIELNFYKVSNLKLEYITTLIKNAWGYDGAPLISEGYDGNLYMAYTFWHDGLSYCDIRFIRIDKNMDIHTTTLVINGYPNPQNYLELIKSFLREQYDNGNTTESIHTDILRNSFFIYEVNYYVSKNKTTGEEIINKVDVSLTFSDQRLMKSLDYGEVVKLTKRENEKGFTTDMCLYSNSSFLLENESNEKIYQLSQASTINQNIYLPIYEIADTKGDIYLAVNTDYDKSFGLLKCKQIEDDDAMFLRKEGKWVRYK